MKSSELPADCPYKHRLQEIDLSGLAVGAVRLLGRPEKIVDADNADMGIEADPEYLEGPWMEKLGDT